MIELTDLRDPKYNLAEVLRCYIIQSAAVHRQTNVIIRSPTVVVKLISRTFQELNDDIASYHYTLRDCKIASNQVEITFNKKYFRL